MLPGGIEVGRLLSRSPGTLIHGLSRCEALQCLPIQGWCSNIGDLLCDSAGAFLLSAGRLLIIGPQQADFYCVRGQDCDWAVVWNLFWLSLWTLLGVAAFGLDE